LKLIDEIVPEPLGGAHRDPALMLQTVRERVLTHLDRFCRMPMNELLARRYQRLQQCGVYQEG
ncbi:MAG: acetyl-CoA carboxylase carboxyl transferase subunit alpha, partial [Nevskiales bacterium]|nr:acetyl-CoA carboxylase carboxyl transferase subunit alpha [Nevskiales bacterium]